jgi:hypothetical protein
MDTFFKRGFIELVGFIRFFSNQANKSTFKKREVEDLKTFDLYYITPF